MCIKIVFICGSLELGQDGVGDYTRRLATELVKTGNKAGIVALNDKHIKNEFNGTQEVNNYNIPVLRLPSYWPERSRFKEANLWIEAFDPDWISLQFVLFSFHNKGLPLNLSKYCVQLSKERKWHMMFHELWVGMDETASLKLRLWSGVQKKLIKMLISKTKPAAMHTQTKLYQWQLNKIGHKVNYLPLFSNIPIPSTINNNTSTHLIDKVTNPKITLVMFGGIHAGSPIEQFSKEAYEYSQEQNIEVSLKIVGRTGNEQTKWATIWQSFGLALEILGERSEAEISEVLGSADIGITTTPLPLAEKSGTVAAMREHGLPIICVRHPWKPRGYKEIYYPPGVKEYKPGNIKELFNDLQKSWTTTNLSNVTQILLNDLIHI